MTRFGASRRLVHSVVTVLVICSGLMAANEATAKMAVERVTPMEGRPGDSLKVLIACGGGTRGGCTQTIPVSMVPVSQIPAIRPCQGNGSCPPTALRPPSRRPYVFLGRARRVPESDEPGGASRFVDYYRLRSQLPSVRPGFAAFVIWCGACAPGARGGLIVDPPAPPGPHTPLFNDKGRLIRPLLRVRQANVSAADNDVQPLAWIATAAGIGIVGLCGALLLGRRRPRDRIFS